MAVIKLAGNPLTWRDGAALSWQHGDTITTFYLNGSSVLTQKTGDERIDFLYDDNSQLLGLKYNGTSYYYRKNQQRNIIGILDPDGEQVVSYTYDAWGSCTGSLAGTIGQKNPFRYHGYYYDTESGLYYLNSRYYDPEAGRFINTDDETVLDGGNDHLLENNLFAYCFNNPVNMYDETGTWPQWVKNLTKVAVGVAAITAGVVATAMSGGAATVVLAASLKIAVSSAAAGAVGGAGFSAVAHRVTTGSWKGAGKAAIKGAVDGAADGFMTGGIAAGTAFTTAAAKGVKIKKIGKLKPKGKEGYYGVKYSNRRNGVRSLELHPPHKGGRHQKWHW